MNSQITDWQGSTPNDWVSGNLGRFGKFIGGTGFPHEHQGIQGEAIKFFKVSDTNLLGNEKYLINSENSISKATAKELSAKLMPAGSIVFPKVGAALLGNKRRIMVEDGVSDNNTMAFVPVDGETEFWFYALSIMDFGQLSNPGPVPSINESQLRSFNYNAPPVDIRPLIAKFLLSKVTRIDALITEKQHFIDLLKEKRQALISHYVTKGLDPTVPMKDSGVEWIGEIPEHWSMASLKHLCDLIKDGTHNPPARVDSGVPLLSVRNIINGKYVLRDDDSQISEESFKELSRYFQIAKGDVLLAIVGGTIGKTAIVGEMPPHHIQRSLGLFRTKFSELRPQYLHYFFQSRYFQELLWSNVGFSAQPGIYLGSLANFSICAPPLKEQEEIINRLNGQLSIIDELISESVHFINLLAEHRTALISAAVTGKIDVRDLAASPTATP